MTVRKLPDSQILSNHTRELAAVVERCKNLEVRVTGIEEARRSRQLEEVRREEREKARAEALDIRLKAINNSIAEVKADVGTIRGAGTKIGWIIAAAILTAIITFTLKGGWVL